MAANKLGDITLTKQTGTVLTLATNGKYVDYDASFVFAVQSGAGAVTIASTDANIVDDSVNRNISGAIGAKASSAPASGYYIKVDASGTGTSTIITPGWLNAGSMGAASATSSFYFPVTSAAASTSGTNTVTPSASISGSNIILSNTDNGISVVSTGGGSASASFNATSTQAGYVPNATQLASGTANAANTTTTASSYISGVTIPIPASGTNTFTVSVPNGDGDTITIEFEVDANGNSNITSDDITSTKMNAVLISGDNYRLESEV